MDAINLIVCMLMGMCGVGCEGVLGDNSEPTGVQDIWGLGESHGPH